jgi:chromosome segregation ATPase
MTEPKLCEEKHKRVDERLDTHEKRLNSHSEELDKLAKSDAVNTTMIGQLIKKLDSLTTAVWALVVVFIGGLVSFFFYAIQSQLF